MKMLGMYTQALKYKIDRRPNQIRMPEKNVVMLL